MGTNGMEYKNKQEESPFETFLKYTDEKEKSSAQLAKVLQEDVRNLSILDIGTGNGEYLALTLTKVKHVEYFHITLIEPSRDLSSQLATRFANILDTVNIRVFPHEFDSFSSANKFDVILASHLYYHIPRPSWAMQLDKMLLLLKPGGRLIVVLREEDDAYKFKMAFKPLIHDKNFKALVLDDVLAALPKQNKLKITRHTVFSELHIPFDNKKDTISIIEFYLNEQWKNIPKSVQSTALKFIKEKDSIFQQVDGIAVIQNK